MGGQLWTSPITGYRRRGTRLAELRALLDGGITARAILEPLQSCPADGDALEMARILAERGFDVAGVQEVPDGPVIGYVEQRDLRRGTVRDHLRPFTMEHLISDATPLVTLLSVFKSRERAFVLVASQVKGIVAHADLNKPPVRVYLFSLVSLLEMHLTFWVRASYPADSLPSQLSASRLARAKELQEHRQQRNQEMSLVDCLQFCDKSDLVLRRPELLTELGLTSKKHAKRLLERAEDLRNLLAHGHDDLCQGSSWEELIDLVERIEGLLHRSDALVEKKASGGAMVSQDALWKSA